MIKNIPCRCVLRNMAALFFSLVLPYIIISQTKQDELNSSLVRMGKFDTAILSIRKEGQTGTRNRNNAEDVSSSDMVQSVR